MDARLLGHELQNLSGELQGFGHAFTYEGDQTLEGIFQLNGQAARPFTNIQPFHKEGTLIVYQGQVGTLSEIDGDFKNAVFQPLGMQTDKRFYEHYTSLRDQYLEISEKESTGTSVHQTERDELNQRYDQFISQYGQLNSQGNHRRILEDTAFGLTMLSSLERREGEHFVKSDMLNATVQQSTKRFVTDDPIEALAHSLNDTGKVDIGFIGAAMGLEEPETIALLGEHIYLNPVSKDWETADQFLSGNVVEKLRQAKQQVGAENDIPQVQRSLTALEKVQPERIPFELLDFNLGERWIPVSYYERFAAELFEQHTDINYFPSLDAFKVTTGMNTKVAREFAVTPKSGRTTYGYTLLEHALENTTPFFT